MSKETAASPGILIAGMPLLMMPGPGWGDGQHETTQLCLKALATFAPKGPNGSAAWRLLDFGSGSGLLSIGAAKLGAQVEAVEIDEAGIAHAEQNAKLNGVSERIRFSRSLAAVTDPCDFVVANILRPVLLEHAGELVSKLSSRSTLVLSGLVSTDLPEVSVKYAARLTENRQGRSPEIYQRGEWRALVWRF